MSLNQYRSLKVGAMFQILAAAKQAVQTELFVIHFRTFKNRVSSIISFQFIMSTTLSPSLFAGYILLSLGYCISSRMIIGLHPIYRNFPETDRFMLARIVSSVGAFRCGAASGMLPFPWNQLAKCSLFTALVRLECFYQVSCTLGWLMDFQFVLSSLSSCFLKSRHCQAFRASFWTNSHKFSDLMKYVSVGFVEDNSSRRKGKDRERWWHTLFVAGY